MFTSRFVTHIFIAVKTYRRHFSVLCHIFTTSKTSDYKLKLYLLHRTDSLIRECGQQRVCDCSGYKNIYRLPTKETRHHCIWHWCTTLLYIQTPRADLISSTLSHSFAPQVQAIRPGLAQTVVYQEESMKSLEVRKYRHRIVRGCAHSKLTVRTAAIFCEWRIGQI
jgi:hypothetical protein